MIPDVDTLYQTNEITASPVVSYPINFTTAQTYTVWLRGYPTNAAGDSVVVSWEKNGLKPLASRPAPGRGPTLPPVD